MEIAFTTCVFVIPSYGLVKIKLGSWDSIITYSSSIITYFASFLSLSINHDAISIPFDIFISISDSERFNSSKYLSLIKDGVISITFPGNFL